MKKIVSAIIISALAVSSIPFIPAPITVNYNTAVAEADNLNSLASFLGADTDYFNFSNYTKNYLDTDMVITDCEDQSYGMSMLQILSHNGVFAVSDIQKGAENLNNIQFDSELETLIEKYQLTRFNVPQIKMKRQFVKNDTTTLIKSATDSMTAQKYFHISLSLSDNTNNGKTHDVTGIGISDGSWSFNGKSYDKCILTLDSNNIGFDENYCIYVNTSDNTFCIPAYDSEITLTAVIADDTILNYQGVLGEQVQPPVDVTDPVTPDYPAVDPENSAEIEMGVRSFNVSDNGLDPDDEQYKLIYDRVDKEYNVTVNDFVYDSFYFNSSCNYESKLTVPVSESYKFDFKDTEADLSEVYFGVLSKDGESSISARNYADSAEVSAHKVQMGTTIGDSISAYLKPSAPLYKSSYNTFKATAFYCTNFTMTDRTDGILLSSDSPYSANIAFTYSDNEDKTLANLQFRISPSAGDILVRYDEEVKKIRVFIDKDSDDIYETEIQNGDINCDGLYDAHDASAILETYSILSVDEDYPEFYVNIFSDTNGDGVIDSKDASDVLTKYAEISTS